MRVFTWNVLHRVHAETYGEPAITQWPDEARRVREVVSRCRQLLGTDGVGLLQETSGDLVTALTHALPGCAVHGHRLPRVPRVKQTKLVDPTELLVVIAPKGSTVRRASTFESDPGKGFLAVESAGVTFVSTHLSFGEKGTAQLEALRDALTSIPGPLVLGGDFNAELSRVTPHLAPLQPVALANDSMATREVGDERLFIDHLFGRGVRLDHARAVEHPGLSDHRPVVTTL